ncbi:hypothetical protein BC940DRAFT_366417 [Gongronella butleri]|nr:hypothetical protein BC940DRAFT_366417 [Gongronella butleri]
MWPMAAEMVKDTIYIAMHRFISDGKGARAMQRAHGSTTGAGDHGLLTMLIFQYGISTQCLIVNALRQARNW